MFRSLLHHSPDGEHISTRPQSPGRSGSCPFWLMADRSWNISGSSALTAPLIHLYFRHSNVSIHQFQINRHIAQPSKANLILSTPPRLQETADRQSHLMSRVENSYNRRKKSALLINRRKLSITASNQIEVEDHPVLWSSIQELPLIREFTFSK